MPRTAPASGWWHSICQKWNLSSVCYLFERILCTKAAAAAGIHYCPNKNSCQVFCFSNSTKSVWHVFFSTSPFCRKGHKMFFLPFASPAWKRLKFLHPRVFPSRPEVQNEKKSRQKRRRCRFRLLFTVRSGRNGGIKFYFSFPFRIGFERKKRKRLLSDKHLNDFSPSVSLRVFAELYCFSLLLLPPSFSSSFFQPDHKFLRSRKRSQRESSS